MELWKPIEFFEHNYEVSNLGEIRSLTKRNFHNLLPKRIRNGYYVVTLWKNNSQRTVYVHRKVALAFVPNPENKPEVNHEDGNKLNNRASNFKWTTRSENQIHAVLTGLQPSKRKLNVQFQ